MRGKNPRSAHFSRRPRMSRIRGAILTAEEDLSPDASPPRNPPLNSRVSDEIPKPCPPPPSPPSDLSTTVDVSAPATVHRAGDELRPWVALRRRRLPHYFYRRLPNWAYPHRLTHEPYPPSIYKDGRASEREAAVAAGGLEEAHEEEDPENPWEPVWLTIC